ncbi:hypothetical protein Q7A53_05270 [Halobacillus rhizosphaerae]|uniref:hypothetical protein n=1 Tax=Halobacillus rhizosphaerae TaxID=3064889 RepID=UPI00398A8CAE
MEKEHLIKKLIQFRSKACCIYTQQKAHTLWKEIKSELTSKQVNDINDAWHHMFLGKNMKEPFHLTVNEIIEEVGKVNGTY